MKKSILIIILLMVSILTNAQVHKKSNSKPQCDFTGIGIFKIGTDTTVLINYANTHVDEIRNCIGFEDLQYIKDHLEHDSKTHLLRLFKSDLAEVTESYCPDVTEFYLSKYIVSDIVIKNVHFKYYKNRLVEFEADFSDDIINALTSKYEKPTFSCY